MKPTSFARYMSSYLTEYLPGIKGVSHNTLSSKRDAYILLLRYLQEANGLKPEAVDIPLISKDVVVEYLNWLEASRHSSASTRNIRLAAIKSLFHIYRHKHRITVTSASRYNRFPEKRNRNTP